MKAELFGSCICGGVTFEVKGPLDPPDACHCVQCRKQSGHYFASANVPRAALTISRQDTLRWYESSERARRGFCATCGSSLFWDPLAGDKTAVAMGALDSPTGTHLEMHIFVSERGDYYEITDELPQHAR